MPTNAPPAAKPTKNIFDAFNSSATGHQRAENCLSGSTLWRNSRHRKLRVQLAGGAGGGKRMSDTVGAGSAGDVKMGLEETGRVTWFRANDQPSLEETLKVAKDVDRPAKRVKIDRSAMDHANTTNSTTASKNNSANGKKVEPSPLDSPSQLLSPIDPNTSFADSPSTSAGEFEEKEDKEAEETFEEISYPQIFANTAVYINGSTAPTISDHRLKQVLARHGAKISIALGRRTVTHVILGRPNSKGGSGGGLSGSKIQKEMATKQAECVKYVTVEWVLESVKAGKRLPERRFEAVRLAPKGVGSVASIFGAPLKTETKDVVDENDTA